MQPPSHQNSYFQFVISSLTPPTQTPSSCNRPHHSVAPLCLPRRASCVLPLLLAAAQQVQLLLTAGAQVSTASAKGLTALHVAAAAGRVPLLKPLIAAGADPNARGVQSRAAPQP